MTLSGECAKSDFAGIRAFIVHAKDERTRSFYERFGFAPSPTDPRHLFVLVKDLRLTIGYYGDRCQGVQSICSTVTNGANQEYGIGSDIGDELG